MYGPGKLIINQWIKGSEPLVLKEVWYTPHAGHQLLSVPTLTSQGYKCIISNQESSIWDTNENLVIRACASSPNNNLHWFLSESMTPTRGLVNSLVKEDSYELWHQRFGHIPKNDLRQAPFHVTGLPTVTTPVTISPCKDCALGKMHDRSYPPSGKCATHPLELVHTDLVGPMPTESRTRAHYVLTFIDDYSGYALVAFICNKDTTSLHFQAMVSWAETFTGHSLISVHSDHGGEFMAGELQVFFHSRGVTHQTSAPHTPQQNGRAERFNRTLLEKAEAIHLYACLPWSFWQDACETTLHIYNRQPIHRHDWKTPIESFNGDKPDVSYFRVFGTHTYVWIPPKQWQDKLSSKSEEMTFIDYEPNTKGYFFWSKERRRVFVSPNIIFDEKVFPYCSRDKADGHPPIPIEDENLFTALDNLPSDDTQNQREPEPSRDINVPLPLGLGQLPNQPFPWDDEHLSRHSSPSTTPWFPRTDDLSPLQLYNDDTPSGSDNSLPPSYATSPTRPGVKQTQPETGHRSSISDQHQHKRQDGRFFADSDSPPEMERQTVE